MIVAMPLVALWFTVIRQERVGEQSAVVWKFVKGTSPVVGDPVDVRRLDHAAERLHRRVADVVKDDVERVRRPFRRDRLRVRRPVGNHTL